MQGFATAVQARCVLSAGPLTDNVAGAVRDLKPPLSGAIAATEFDEPQ
jgi:hypothetical protein